MTYHFNVTGPDRKALVKAISEHLGVNAKYLGVPSYAFKVGRYTVSKDGALSFEDEGEEELLEETRNLIANLQEAGFHAEELNLPEPASRPEETGEDFEETAISGPADSEEHTLCISLPRARFSEAAIQNLKDLISSKGTLMKRAFQVDELPLKVTDEQVIFPWFRLGTADETEAYMTFVRALGEMAIDRKRISAKEKPITNEKYEFRCFLLRLGMIGDDTKKIRKILMKNLSGSAAFKNGIKKGGEK